MIDRETLNGSTHSGLAKAGTGDSERDPLITPPIYEGVASDPLHRRVLVGVLGSIALAIWIIAWSIIGLVEEDIHTKIVLSFVTFFSVVTLALRVPVLIAALFKTPYDATRKFDAYSHQRVL